VAVEQEDQVDVDQMQLMVQIQYLVQLHQQAVVLVQKIFLEKVMEVQELLVVEV
jgi:hypothetical protein